MSHNGSFPLPDSDSDSDTDSCTPWPEIPICLYVQVFVAFCPDDLTLFVFGDATNEFAEITSMKCPSTVLWYVWSENFLPPESLCCSTKYLGQNRSLVNLVVVLCDTWLKLDGTSWQELVKRKYKAFDKLTGNTNSEHRYNKQLLCDIVRLFMQQCGS